MICIDCQTWIAAGQRCVPCRRARAKFLSIRARSRRTCACGNPADVQSGKCADCSTDSMTDAELDALIAEQMAHLPAWWSAANPRGEEPSAPGPRSRPVRLLYGARKGLNS